MKTRSSRIFAACISYALTHLLFLDLQPAHAAPVTVDFVGEIINVSGSAVVGPFDLGDPVSGRVVYETTGGVDDLPAVSDIARYQQSQILSFDLRAGGYDATADHLSQLGYIKTERREDIDLDGVSFRVGVVGDDVGLLAPYSMQLAIRGPDGSPAHLLPDLDIPDADELRALDVLLPMTGIGATPNFLVFGAPGLDRIDWSVTSYTVTPEPGPTLMVLMGLAVLGRRPLRVR